MTERIITDPNILNGKPVIKGTRIPVYIVLNLIAQGYTFDQIIESYPDLTKEDIKAVLEYASQLTQFEEKELEKI